MTEKDVEQIVKQLSNNKGAHLLFAEHDGGMALSIKCSGEDLYCFLKNLMDVKPVFRDIIKAVAEGYVIDDDEDDALVN